MPHSLKPRALADLDDIYRQSLEMFGQDQAEDYIVGLVDAFAFLSDFPYAMRERLELTPPVRVYRYKSHMILYVIGSNGGIVVLRVAHGRSDWINDPL